MNLEDLLLKAEVEAFLHLEAELLDSRRFDEWLALLADDLVYFMPQRRNVRYGLHAEAENTRQGEGISWFDEDRWTLTKRVEQIQTGLHYAEEPLSRTTHMVSNIMVTSGAPSGNGGADEVAVSCRFLVHQNRVQYETYTFIGRRHDVLRRSPSTPAGWLLARREIILDQNVLLAKNLTTFF